MSSTVLVAPHPDDEVLGGAAVLRSGPVTVVHVTDGVPPWIAARDRRTVRLARRAECDRAWRSLAIDVECVQMGYPDLRAWRSVEEIAASLREVVAASGAQKVFVPGYQRGHPDHDATFLAGALAAGDRASRPIEWWVYGLYGLDRRRRLRFGWLPADRFPGGERRNEPDLLSVKAAALLQFTSQLWPASLLDRWLSDPSPEHFTPLPRRWRRIPDFPSFYDEQLGFARHGAGMDAVEATFAPVLAQAFPGCEPAPSVR